MDNSRSYFFIDGSTLFSQINWLWRNQKGFENKKLDITLFARRLLDVWSGHRAITVRINLYFKKNDERLETHLLIPKTNSPEEKDHWEIIECAEKNPAVPASVLSEIQKCITKKYIKYIDFLSPKEKGLDMKLACDALSLVANNKASNVMLYINDSDYIPLIETCKSLGANVYLTSLTKNNPIQERLCNISDRYLTLDSYLNDIFHIILTQ